MILTHFGSSFETIHDVSASQLEVLVTWPRLLVEKPKRRESFQNSIQSELNSFHFNMNIGSNNTFSNKYYYYYIIIIKTWVFKWDFCFLESDLCYLPLEVFVLRQ